MSVRLQDVLAGAADKAYLAQLSDEQLRSVLAQMVTAQATDRKENQIEYYQPVSPMAEKVHMSQAGYVCIGGGNGASKTETHLAELVMLATGVIPGGLKAEVRDALKAKFRGPVAIRVVVESLTTTLHPIILPKLQWWQWSGTDAPGGKRGHWGWVPRHSLKNGQWANSWSEKLRMLRVLCHDPDTGELLGESTFQFMSHDQDPSDFASGDYHHVLHDEPPKYATWRENEARTMRIGGTMRLAMTWPDDPAIAVDWMYDLLYEKGRPGVNKDENIDWFEMWTADNPHLDQVSVKKKEATWSDEVKAVRLFGRPIRFSNLVHPGFRDKPSLWCTECHKEKANADGCEKCQGSGDFLVEYCHVEDFDIVPGLPTIFLLDPHPRKAHMALWAQVDTWNDIWVCGEMVEAGDLDDVAETVRRTEEELGLSHIAVRLGDPNMLASPSGARREVTWQDEFSAVGLDLELGDVSDVGRSRLNDFLRVDPDRGIPRIHIHPRCVNTARQMQRYVWDDFKQALEKAQKQKAKEKDDDFPTLLKYLMNFNPQFEFLLNGAPVIRTR